MFKGSITALLTPFKNGEVDEKAFAALVEWQIEQGSDGLVPMGTTGESPTLSHDEHKSVVSICVDVAAGRVPVIAGGGSNSTAAAIEFTQFAASAGADAVLSVSPYYNKPSQEGLFQHFAAIAKSSNLPVILYNIPGRSIVTIEIETIARLRAQCSNVIGVKDATADMARATREHAALGADYVMLTGDDMSAIGYNAHGGRGCISVTANVAPALSKRLQDALAQGNFAQAREIHEKLAPLHDALFIEPNPSGVKYAAHKLNLCTSEVRLPMVPVSSQTERAIDEAMAIAGLI